MQISKKACAEKTLIGVYVVIRDRIAGKVERPWFRAPIKFDILA